MKNQRTPRRRNGEPESPTKKKRRARESHEREMESLRAQRGRKREPESPIKRRVFGVRPGNQKASERNKDSKQIKNMSKTVENSELITFPSFFGYRPGPARPAQAGPGRDPKNKENVRSFGVLEGLLEYVFF